MYIIPAVLSWYLTVTMAGLTCESTKLVVSSIIRNYLGLSVLPENTSTWNGSWGSTTALLFRGQEMEGSSINQKVNGSIPQLQLHVEVSFGTILEPQIVCWMCGCAYHRLLHPMSRWHLTCWPLPPVYGCLCWRLKCWFVLWSALSGR